MEEEDIEFVAIDDRLSSRYHHRISRLRELRERVNEVKYHLLTQELQVFKQYLYLSPPTHIPFK